MNATNAHNLLLSSELSRGTEFVASWVNADNVAIIISGLVDNAVGDGAWRFIIATIIAAEYAGFMSPTEVFDTIDWCAGMMHH